jgi:hypothetical protein
MFFWRYSVVGGSATPLAHRPRLDGSQIPVGVHKGSDCLQQMPWMATDEIAARPPKGKHQ